MKNNINRLAFNFFSTNKNILLLLLSILSTLALILAFLISTEIFSGYNNYKTKVIIFALLSLLSLLPISVWIILLREQIKKIRIIRSKQNSHINSVGANNFTVSSKVIPPISIYKVKIEKFYGIKSVEIEFNPESRWIVFTGENASGKTLILRAILIGIIGRRDQRIILAEEESNFVVKFSTYLKSNNSKKNLEIFSKKICAYGPSRLMSLGISTSQLSDKSSVSYSLFNDDGLLLNILTEMPLWHSIDYPKYKMVHDTLLTVLVTIKEIILDKEKKKIVFIEKDEPSITKDISQLAAGIRVIVNIIGDIILRLSADQKEIKQTYDLEGIVLIDEFELHLHPNLIKCLPGQLTRIFPKVQFIVSTHNPITLLGVPKGSMIFNVHHSIETGVCVERLDNMIDFTTLLPNSLLTSDIFSMEDFVSIAGDTDDVETTDNYQIIEQEKRLREKLNILNQSDFDLLEEIKKQEDEKGN